MKVKKFLVFGKLAVLAGLLFSSCNNLESGNEFIQKNTACVKGKIVFENSNDFSGAKIFLVKQPAEKKSAINSEMVKNFVSKADFFETGRHLESCERSLIPGLVIENYFVTDEDGYFSFTELEAGFYNLYVYCEKSLEKMKERSVLALNNHDLITADFHFTKTCSVKGSLLFSDDEEIDRSGFSVAVEGSSVRALTDNSGSYLLSDIPLRNPLNLYISKNEIAFPLSIELFEEEGIIEKESIINLENIINPEEIDEKSSFNYRGVFNSSDEIESPQEYDFYFNENDGSSYIFIDENWVLLARGGLDGKDGINGRDGIDGKDGRDGKDGNDGNDGKDAVCLFEVLSVKEKSGEDSAFFVEVQVFSQFDLEEVTYKKGVFNSMEEFFSLEERNVISAVEGRFIFEVTENGVYAVGVRDVKGNRNWKTIEICECGNLVKESSDEDNSGEISVDDEKTIINNPENESESNLENNINEENPSDCSIYEAGKVILYENGNYIFRNVEELTEVEKKCAVAVCFGLSENGIPLGLALNNSYAEKSNGKLAWASSDSFGAVTKFENLVCIPSDNVNPESFEGELSGKNSYSEITLLDADGTSNGQILSENYPSIAYAHSYGENCSIKTGWYLPSIKELYNIYLNLVTINEVLLALDGTPMAVTTSSSYYSSSQSDSAAKVYKISMSSGKIVEGTKTVSRDTYACAVREFPVK